MVGLLLIFIILSFLAISTCGTMLLKLITILTFKKDTFKNNVVVFSIGYLLFMIIWQGIALVESGSGVFFYKDLEIRSYHVEMLIEILAWCVFSILCIPLGRLVFSPFADRVRVCAGKPEPADQLIIYIKC